ncbi:hypothetical protein K2173_008032 [Erythroxylum novogranatense]|uniref:PB1 domain-containing protein n=1 Tax=Erythroxylum novogranatense TaxID=1862640 RepID=A0AAV8T8U1_9ROSI|nr:hypothetical protein K2173_008032 [Erythroxylum novogranatense]
MESFSYSSYPESGDSSPRSREIDENPSWEEPPSNNYKVKFMCSYGGKIQPRPHDNQLAYIGGDTKILAVDRSIRFSTMMNKLTSLCGDSDVCFKYQLPGEDLDALISVTNDEDLEHMMLEYDRLYRASAKPARLRLFLFHLNLPSFGASEMKSERQWFVDALNSVQVQNVEAASPPTAAVPVGNPDFLFGLEKGFPATKTVPEIVAKEVAVGSDCGTEDRHLISDVVVNQQVHDFQRLQIATVGHEQVVLSRKADDLNSKGYCAGEFYSQKVPDKMVTTSTPVQLPVQMPIQGTYLPERHIASMGIPISAAGTEQPVYLVPTPAAVYPTPSLRPVTGQVGQGYYGVQRVVQDVFRDQPVYGGVPSPAGASIQQQAPAKVGVYSEGVGSVQQKMGVPDQGYMQVGYDSAGRQVYYTTPYQTIAAAPVTIMDNRQVGGSGGALNQDGLQD